MTPRSGSRDADLNEALCDAAAEVFDLFLPTSAHEMARSAMLKQAYRDSHDKDVQRNRKRSTVMRITSSRG